MKYSLRCVLFGHEWLTEVIYKDEKGKILDRKWEPRDNCIHCGLSKSEVGITKKD